MREFQFLVPATRATPKVAGGSRPPTPRTAANTVLLAIPHDVVRRKYVVWSQVNYHYYVFDTIGELEQHIADTPAKDRCFYEVIFGDAPQRIKFDIDEATPDEMKKIMAVIKRCWQRSDASLGPYEKRRGAKMHVFQTGATAFHIVIDHVVSNVEAVKQFVDEVTTDGGGGVAALLDQRVYSRIQNFRLVGSHKKDKDFVKRPVSGGVTLAQSLISWHK